MERSTDAPEAILEALVLRGWCFRSPAEEVRDLIRSKSSVEKGRMLESVESELLGLDLRSIGGKSLPDATTMKKSSHLQGPKVLQVVSVRDTSRSSIDASFRNFQHDRRLLRFILTDGNCEVTAVEYTPIPTITEEIVPGTKVRLENRIAIHNGILCLNPKVVNILGGLVQSLFEEWQLEQKYSGISRSTFRQSRNSEDAGPPPFEKLQLDGRSHQVAQQRSLRGSHPNHPQTVSAGSLPLNSDDRQVSNQGHQIVEKGKQKMDSTTGSVDDDRKMASIAKRIDGNTSSSEPRPKEVIEATPVQNQAAAQKLLQKMTQPSHEGRHYRGSRQRGKCMQEDNVVFTLDEWERRKAGTSRPIVAGGIPDVSRDEELARRLQQQLDLEDLNVQARQETETEKIRMNMFSFARAEERTGGRTGFRGRGRGRGRTRYG